MSNRMNCSVAFLSIIIVGSGSYMGYYIFIDNSKELIERFNWLRLCLFFVQHIITLGMLMRLLRLQQNDNLILWMFQLSSINLLIFAGGQIYSVIHGGRIFGSSSIGYQDDFFNDQQDDVYEFQLNWITLYFQIMTNFIMFLIISGIGLIVMRYRLAQEQDRYEFMIDNLRSQDYVDEPNAEEKKTCSICLTDLDSQRVLKLPCDHFFHKQCLKDWLKRSAVCPLCRNDIQQSLDPNSPLRHQYFNFQAQPYPPPQMQQIIQPLPIINNNNQPNPEPNTRNIRRSLRGSGERNNNLIFSRNNDTIVQRPVTAHSNRSMVNQQTYVPEPNNRNRRYSINSANSNQIQRIPRPIEHIARINQQLIQQNQQFRSQGKIASQENGHKNPLISQKNIRLANQLQKDHLNSPHKKQQSEDSNSKNNILTQINRQYPNPNQINYLHDKNSQQHRQNKTYDV